MILTYSRYSHQPVKANHKKPIFYKKPTLKPWAFFALATLAAISLAGVIYYA